MQLDAVVRHDHNIRLSEITSTRWHGPPIYGRATPRRISVQSDAWPVFFRQRML